MFIVILLMLKDEFGVVFGFKVDKYCGESN